MIKKIVSAAVMLGITSVAATADIYSQANNPSAMKYGSSEMLPPPGYRGQWWTAPNKCEYSRAGRPGEVVWYLIINSAHSGCETRLIGKVYADYN